MASGVNDCPCCGAHVMVADWTVPELCDDCDAAGCDETGQSPCDRPQEDEPAPGDYTITPCGPLGGLSGLAVVEGPFLGQFPDDSAAVAFARERMAREKFWPAIWIISDHGNVWPYTD